MKPFAYPVGLRAFNFGFRMIYVVELQIYCRSHKILGNAYISTHQMHVIYSALKAIYF
jgi:hypothetical protein